MISIIVPVYNVEQYLPDCIRSILRQTYKDFELILGTMAAKMDEGKVLAYRLIDN